MTLQEKILYHQIHPLKLLTDWGAGIIALYPFWQHNLLLALLIAFIPSILVSFLLIRFANLDKYKQSPFGKYIHQYMTHPIEMLRAAGYVLMAGAAWVHAAWAIPVGFLIVLLAWLRGIMFPTKA
jgi:hypothetical protein